MQFEWNHVLPSVHHEQRCGRHSSQSYGYSRDQPQHLVVRPPRTQMVGSGGRNRAHYKVHVVQVVLRLYVARVELVNVADLWSTRTKHPIPVGIVIRF